MALTQERREDLRHKLLAAAERQVAGAGFRSLRARDLAAEVGCALGQIYNVYPDLDALVVAVNARTLDELDGLLGRATANASASIGSARAVLIEEAKSYFAFAQENRNRWQAIFEHRLGPGREAPAWYRQQQEKLFSHVEGPLKALLPNMGSRQRATLARSIFSAVHGIVWLGLEELLEPSRKESLEGQLEILVGAMVDGLEAQAAREQGR